MSYDVLYMCDVKILLFVLLMFYVYVMIYFIIFIIQNLFGYCKYYVFMFKVCKYIIDVVYYIL